MGACVPGSLESFPINLRKYKLLELFLDEEQLRPERKEQLQTNLDLIRDTIVFFTALANAKGVGGHTGGAYDIVPEALIVDGFMRLYYAKIVPVLFDEAGHRVALQYALAALDPTKSISLEDLLHYREYQSGLPGHPELDEKLGIGFSSGRLGHLWGDVNGIAQRERKKVVLFGSDGSQMEGNNAEAARFAVAHKLPVVLIIDDNNVTIEGHPSAYLTGFDVAKTLQGHGLEVRVLDSRKSNGGLAVEKLYSLIREALLYEGGPIALVHRREMAPGIVGIEDSHKGHDAIPVPNAIDYLRSRGHTRAVEAINAVKKVVDPVILEDPHAYRGSTKETGSNRTTFGKVLADIMQERGAEGRQRVLVYSADLGGSTGVDSIQKRFPDRYITGGVMERGLFLAAAGFGSAQGYQGIFATFSAFSEMLNSEIQMVRLNGRNVLVHFSHVGVDWMADNTCHYGTNITCVDNGLGQDTTRLYVPADPLQMEAVLRKVYDAPGLRFIFSTRSTVPFILDKNNQKFFDSANSYQFTPGKDEVIREGNVGYVVTYGEMLYRCLDAVEQLHAEGIDIGLVNRPTLNVIDKTMLGKVGSSPLVVFVESQNVKTGFGNRYAAALLESGYHPTFRHLAITQTGAGGLYEHIPHQGLTPKNIKEIVKEVYVRIP